MYDKLNQYKGDLKKSDMNFFNFEDGSFLNLLNTLDFVTFYCPEYFYDVDKIRYIANWFDFIKKYKSKSSISDYTFSPKSDNDRKIIEKTIDDKILNEEYSWEERENFFYTGKREHIKENLCYVSIKPKEKHVVKKVLCKNYNNKEENLEFFCEDFLIKMNGVLASIYNVGDIEYNKELIKDYVYLVKLILEEKYYWNDNIVDFKKYLKKDEQILSYLKFLDTKIKEKFLWREEYIYINKFINILTTDENIFILYANYIFDKNNDNLKLLIQIAIMNLYYSNMQEFDESKTPLEYLKDKYNFKDKLSVDELFDEYIKELEEKYNCLKRENDFNFSQITDANIINNLFLNMFLKDLLLLKKIMTKEKK